jgi:hypothetical protein
MIPPYPAPLSPSKANPSKTIIINDPFNPALDRLLPDTPLSPMNDNINDEESVSIALARAALKTPSSAFIPARPGRKWANAPQPPPGFTIRWNALMEWAFYTSCEE